MRRFSPLITVAAMLAMATMSFAVPKQMTLQGHLRDGSTPVTGTRPVQFTIFDAEVGGASIWTESGKVAAQDGLFTSLLGETTELPASLFTGQMLWIEINIDGTILLPRRPLGSVAYSFKAQRADTAAFALNAGAAANTLWSTDGTNVWRPSGNVGVGTSTPTHALEAHSTTPGQVGFFHSTSASGTNYGMDAGAQGIGAETNIGAYLYASGAANNYAIIVPYGYGNVGIGTTTPSTSHMLEVRTASTGKAAFLRTDANYGTNIGVDGEAMGSGAATNIGGWFNASGAANNYAIIVPPGSGKVGIGTIDPGYKLHVVGDVQIEGNLNVSGTKCRIVMTDVGQLRMNAVESAHALFMDDEPSARLVNGRCRVNLSSKFLSTVTANGKYPLAVNVTFYEPHAGNWYVMRDDTGFTVIDPGGSSAEFSWQVIARQRDYKDVYLDPLTQTATKERVRP